MRIQRRVRRMLSGLMLALLLAGAVAAGLAEEAPAPEWNIQGDVLVGCSSRDGVVTVPEGIRVIGANAFRGLKTLEAVVLPASVESIGARAFAECEKLRQVILPSGSQLMEIGDQAFLNCRELNIGFVPDSASVAENAFEGVQQSVPKTSSDQSDKPDSGSEDGQAEPAEEPADQMPARRGGGGGTGLPQGHARNTLAYTGDYDLLSLKDIPEEGTAPMECLTLGGEELAVSLRQAENENGEFSVSVMNWQDPGREDSAEMSPDTMILTAAEGEDGENCWILNGEVLRKMNKSGIGHLILRAGDRIAVLETEGFLAGWKYDELKSRGTPGRRFEYEIEMNGENLAAWRVTVGEERYELTSDSRAGIFLTGTGTYCGSAEVLNRPYGSLFGSDGKQR